ncbi:unnamed protein product [Didymodactylos carnosus]|uniref:CENP-V/GFA domain-containing protein n=1 Tax=Didymodactylos carnosus TaxID=1234261 RepID=A0A814P3W8_9BILA|nr:unnamed protein product [Didymodactylos carnosus]CAF1099593.1 unnamed protein product [Didymodactylos carnosus]CAF3728811.1 unnamed protein product [Didymodactylos carnosus]CAF3864638.1 unnamed protein product [Didymodactylos carnosus]
MSSTTGKCLCGQISVSVSKEVLSATDNITLCHCKNCRQSGGALASVSVIAPESTVKISGVPKIYQDVNTDSGKPLERAFCGNCGSPIYTASPNVPGIQVIKLGLFDEIPKPGMESYCKARPPWDKPVDNAKQFNTMPTK